MGVIIQSQININRINMYRDKNAVLNMRKIVIHFLKTGKRLIKYRRGVAIKEIEEKNNIIKDENPSIDAINLYNLWSID